MSLMGWIAVGIAGKWVLNKLSEANEEDRLRREQEEKRKNTSCSFQDGISYESFQGAAKKLAKRFDRISHIDVNGPVISCTVDSRSGISEWEFTVDYNDWGHITGSYWLWQENDDSSIPEAYAEKLKAGIQEHLLSGGDDGEADDSDSYCYEPQEAHKDVHPSSNDSVLRSRTSENKSSGAVTVVLLVLLAVGLAFSYFKYQELQKSKLTVIGISSEECVGQRAESISAKLKEAGFTRISECALEDLPYSEKWKEGTVTSVSINGNVEFSPSSKYPYDSKIEVFYHSLSLVLAPITSKEAKGKDYSEIVSQFENSGFASVRICPIYDLVTGWVTKDLSVENVTIDGNDKYDLNASYRPDAEVTISYHTFKSNAPKN